MDSILGSQLATAWIVTKVIQWLKKQPWFPFANFNTATLNRVTASLIGIATAIGLTVTFDPEIGRLIVDGLILRNVVTGVIVSIQQIVFQQIFYKGLIDRPGAAIPQEPVEKTVDVGAKVSPPSAVGS